jgi:hypothetical protein
MKNSLPALLILLASLPVAAQAVPQQKLKNAMELSYAVGDGRACVAHLESSDCDLCATPAQRTHDPLWITSCSKNKQEWLGYKGGDGKLWWAKIHASYDPGMNFIHMAFEHHGPDDPHHRGDPDHLPNGTNESNEHHIVYFGADGNKYDATLSGAEKNIQPAFVVKLVSKRPSGATARKNRQRSTIRANQ